MPEEELDATLDEYLLVDVILATIGHPRHELDGSADLASAAEEAARKFPVTVAALHEHLEARAEERAREIVAASQAEPQPEPVETTATPEPVEPEATERADDVSIVLEPKVPSRTVERLGREPYHGWTAGYTT